MATEKDTTPDMLEKDALTVTNVSDVDNDEVFTFEQQRKIIRRIDYRLILMTGGLYAISLIDRSNIAFTAVAGMTKDLDMLKSYRYVCPRQTGSLLLQVLI